MPGRPLCQSASSNHPEIPNQSELNNQNVIQEFDIHKEHSLYLPTFQLTHDIPLQGLALFLLLSFRTNSSYERWWEGEFPYSSALIKFPFVTHRFVTWICWAVLEKPFLYPTTALCWMITVISICWTSCPKVQTLCEDIRNQLSNHFLLQRYMHHKIKGNSLTAPCQACALKHTCVAANAIGLIFSEAILQRYIHIGQQSTFCDNTGSNFSVFSMQAGNFGMG